MEIIELTDDGGQIEKFQLADTFGMNDDTYAALISLEDEDRIYILRLDYSEEDIVSFIGVDDDELKDAIEVYEDLKKED